MTLRTTLLAIFAASTFVACNQANNKETADGSKDTLKAPIDTNKTASPASFKAMPFNTAYQHYLHLKDALVTGKADEAQNGAKQLGESLKTVKATVAATLAEQLGKTTDIKEQRTIFSTLSEEMAKLAKNEELASGAVYIAFCPMANKDKGAIWLANEQEIRNPYFGDEMLNCGSVKETLK